MAASFVLTGEIFPPTKPKPRFYFRFPDRDRGKKFSAISYQLSVFCFSEFIELAVKIIFNSWITNFPSSRPIVCELSLRVTPQHKNALLSERNTPQLSLRAKRSLLGEAILRTGMRLLRRPGGLLAMTGP
jgi:hypothetical protein